MKFRLTATVAASALLLGLAAPAFAAPAALAATLAARASGRGVHVDCSQYEAMMHSFQVFRPMYESMAPDYEFPRQFMIPSIEPASDGMVAMCCVTGQQWQDFCTMIGAPEFGDDPMLFGFIALKPLGVKI